MKITINKDGSLIIDGEGNTTIEKNQKLEWIQVVDLSSICTKLEFKGFKVKNIEDKGKDLMSYTPNYPMAGIVHEAESQLIVSKEMNENLSEISNEDLQSICKEEKEKIIKEENENNKKHI